MNKKRTVFFILSFMISTYSFPTIYGEMIGEDLGRINDLIVSNSAIYFFEYQPNNDSSTWNYDTYIMKSEGKDINQASKSLFIYPTELNDFENDLYFATLSDQCLGITICDYQDIIKMSKTDGSFEKIVMDLKSAIHISLNDKKLFVSESNGKIWEISLDGHEKKLLYSGNNIIMDITAHGNSAYWIEEIEDQNNRILGITNEEEPRIIDANLKIPYDLRVEDGILHWNEISIMPTRGTIAEFTELKTFFNNSVETKSEFENTSPLSKDRVSYGPYRVYGDFLFLVNNTQNNSIIHLLNFSNNTKYNISTVTDYDIKFLRNDMSNLYVVGVNDSGFIIEKFPLLVNVPEFPMVMIFSAIIMGLSLTVVSRKFFHY
ncbi:hypothetical protein [Nitrosopumilus ureiphilus]|nr:hypothetical protein [Nitrosopumilus ureiphilus]